MLLNPVLKREFLTSLRTTRAYILGLVFLWSLAGMVLLMWPAEGVYSLSAQSSHKLFIFLSMGFLALVTMFAPSFTAVSITMEKEHETYDLLYDTMLRPDEILIGKFVAGVGYVLILILCSLPMMGACFVLGGVSAGDVLKVYLIVGETAVFFGLIGLYCSVNSYSSYRALIVCYITILVICGVTWVPSIVLGLWAETVHLIHLVRALSPFAALISVTYPDMFAAEHPVTPPQLGVIADSMWVFVVCGGVGSLVLFFMTYRAIAAPPQPKPRAEEDVLDEADQLSQRKLRFPFYLLDPRRRKRMIGAIINVIAVKEMRTKAFGRAEWMFRTMAMCFIASLVLAFLPLTQINKIGVETIVLTCISIPLAIIILMSPVLTASGVTEERQSGVFEMLRSTLVSPRTFIMGKLEVAWFLTLLILCSTVPTFFVLVYVSSTPSDMEHMSKGVNLIRPFNFQFGPGWEELKQVELKFLWKMLSAFAVVVVSMIFATVSGIFSSAFSKKTSTATAIAYSIVLFLSFGTLIPYFLAESLPEWLVEASLTVNPFAAAAKAVTVEVFPDLPPDLWLCNIEVVGGVTFALLIASIIRIWQLMRPSK